MRGDTPAERPVVDMAGRTVMLPARVERVAAVRPGALRLLLYVDGAQRVAAVESVEKRRATKPYLMPFPELAGRPSLGPPHGGDPELIAARALAQRPRLLLIDEPTANLDLRHQLDVLEVLRREVGRPQDARRMSAIVAIHDLNQALHLADDFVLLDRGRVKARGSVDGLDPGMVRNVFDVDIEPCHHGGRRWLLPVVSSRMHPSERPRPDDPDGGA